MFLKLMGAFPGYIYGQDNTGIYVNLFVASTAEIKLGGHKLVLKQATDYPWQGHVKLKIEPANATEFDLRIRIPGWCDGQLGPDELYRTRGHALHGAARLKVNGKAVEAPNVVRGYATLHRKWKTGDVVELALSMPVQPIKATELVEADRGRTAWMRGPIVYCFEAADNGGAVDHLAIPPGTDFTPEFRPDFLGGVTVLNATAKGTFRTSAKHVVAERVKVTAIPYYANANRGTCQMQVWMADDQEKSKPLQQE
jgi:uncharacterized protein